MTNLIIIALLAACSYGSRLLTGTNTCGYENQACCANAYHYGGYHYGEPDRCYGELECCNGECRYKIPVGGNDECNFGQCLDTGRDEPEEAWKPDSPISRVYQAQFCNSDGSGGVNYYFDPECKSNLHPAGGIITSNHPCCTDKENFVCPSDVKKVPTPPPTLRPIDNKCPPTCENGCWNNQRRPNQCLNAATGFPYANKIDCERKRGTWCESTEEQPPTTERPIQPPTVRPITPTPRPITPTPRPITPTPRPIEQPPTPPPVVGIGDYCTMSAGNAETIAAVTGVSLAVHGIVPVSGPFGTLMTVYGLKWGIDALAEAIKDGNIICEEGLWCCNNVCRQLQKDWIGVDYCPNECSAGPGCGVGTCPNDRKAGESCSCAQQCATQSTWGCCEGGKCVDKQTDHAGFEFCPSECKAGPFCPNGSCGRKETKLENQQCSCDEECRGFGLGFSDMACCGGKCKRKENGFCPPKELGESCVIGTDCRNYGLGTTDVDCCKGICTRKLKDWAGFGYCPHECVGRFAGQPGTC